MSSREPPTRQPAAQSSPSPPSTGLVRTQSVAGPIVTTLGGLLIVLGSFLPWLTVDSAFNIPTFTYNGMERGDGIITLILGVVAIVIAARQLIGRRLPAGLRRFSIATGVIAGIVVIYDYLDFMDVDLFPRGGRSVEKEHSVFVGSGTGILIFGAILVIVGGVLLRDSKS
jgi:formate-dependent nitrite reductase membrane component NrfD